jgi:hypothetical protein
MYSITNKIQNNYYTKMYFLCKRIFKKVTYKLEFLLETEFLINSYLAVKKLPLRYKDQSVNSV